MKNNPVVLGIIAEYNPFHQGHAYQLETLRELTSAQTIIVLMSGNVVQRGEFALIDKWKRAEAALQSGADLVLEAPTVASLQGADYFANYNVKILQQLKVTTLGFGTESANARELKEFVQWQNSHKNDIDKYMKNALNEGNSYAASYHDAIHQLGKVPSFDVSSPNHLLAIQYVKTNETFQDKMEIVALPRLAIKEGQRLYSGSEIRQALKEGEQPIKLVPASMAQLLKGSVLMDWGIAYPFLRYRLAQHHPASLRKIWGMREGIEHLILKNIYQTNNYVQFLDSMISRRWTKSSIQRILMSILLDISNPEWHRWQTQLYKQPTVQVLGFNEVGRNHLKTLKSQDKVTMISIS